MIGISRFLRNQFGKTVDMMVAENTKDAEVIGTPGFYVTADKPGEGNERRLLLDKEIRDGISYYLYQEV